MPLCLICDNSLVLRPLQRRHCAHGSGETVTAAGAERTLACRLAAGKWSIEGARPTNHPSFKLERAFLVAPFHWEGEATRTSLTHLKGSPSCC